MHCILYAILMSFILNFQSCTWSVTTWRIELLQVHHDVSVPPGTVLWEAGQPRTSAGWHHHAGVGHGSSFWSYILNVYRLIVLNFTICRAAFPFFVGWRCWSRIPIWKVIRPHFGGLTSHFTSYKSRSCSLHKFYDRFEWVIFWFKSVSVSLFLFLSFLFFSILSFLSFFLSPSLNQSI